MKGVPLVFLVLLSIYITAGQYQSGENLVREVKDVLNYAMEIVRQRMRSEATMAEKMKYVVDSRPFRYVTAFLYAKPYAKYISHSGVVLIEAAKALKNSNGYIDKSMRILKPMSAMAVPDTQMTVPPDIDYCPYPTHYICDKYNQFRTIDGSCNNLKRAIWGRSMVPQRRLLPAHYADGIETMRRARDGSPLPGPRQVSVRIFQDRDRPSEIHTLLLMIWGQFIDHDVTRTAITQASMEEEGFGETDEVKCGYDGCQSHLPGQEACWPIPVTADDPDFGYTNKCLKFVRSQEVPALNCKPGPRQQLNQVTPWIDGSQIYGSTVEEATAIRDFSDQSRGWMRMTPHPHGPRWKHLLPQQDIDLCRETNVTIKCFLAGDERVNEQAGLTAMHTMWVRQHNRIESELHKINPHWTGEKLYQVTRRIVGAMIQHIAYNEQLPLVLGGDVMRQFGIDLTRKGFYHGYDPSFDPRVSQSFASAAYRFGHTLIQDRFKRTNYKYHQDDSIMLSSAFRRPHHVYNTQMGGVDSIIRGLCDFEAQTFDRFFTKQITRSLFTERPPFGVGMDLLSLNIQRGRDHGISAYNDYREFCGLTRAIDFEDLAKEIPDAKTRATLRRIYRHVDDIDLFPGGVSEASVAGGVVGPTFACILGNQFQHIRKGDRYWYENDNDVGLTLAQINEIRKVRLSRVLCANGDFVDSIQPWAMMKPFREVYNLLAVRGHDPLLLGMEHTDFDKLFEEDFNARVPCSSLPDIDLTKWRHGPYVG